MKKEFIYILGGVILVALLNKKIKNNEANYTNASGRRKRKPRGSRVPRGKRTGDENNPTITTPFPEYETPVPIGGFQLCCLWGCDDCQWTWGGGQKWVHNTTGRIHIHRR